MDQRDKKRSRSDKAAVDDGIGGGRKKKEKATTEGDDGMMVPSTTEDEVNEFFAILRRMHVAVKYFERGNGAGGARGLTETLVVTPSLETDAAPAVDEDVKVCVKSGNGVVLDLNTVPEGECSSL